MRVLAWVALVMLSVPAQAQSRVASDARALEQRLRAPCCRGLLLDAHESEATHALRREIRARLEQGESSAAIEATFVRRYGESIVAVPLDADPRSGVAIVLAVVLAATALLIAVFGLRWVRRSRATVLLPQGATSDRDDELDSRIDAELRSLET